MSLKINLIVIYLLRPHTAFLVLCIRSMDVKLLRRPDAALSRSVKTPSRRVSRSVHHISRCKTLMRPDAAHSRSVCRQITTRPHAAYLVPCAISISVIIEAP